MIKNWLKMMNVKGKYFCDRMRDEFGFPWELRFDSFKGVNESCDIISVCAWKGGRTRVMKLTTMTAYHLLTEMKFSYVYKQFFQMKLEKFFSQTQQRSGGNFYFDIGDVTAGAKTVNVQNLLKIDLLPVEIINLAVQSAWIQ